MKKKVLIILIGIGIIQAFFWTFNILRFYNYPSDSNEPNLRAGSKIVWSSLVEPARMDFICYIAKDKMGTYESGMRVVGLPNDILEIKRGVLIVNGINMDENLELRRPYRIHKDYFNSVIKSQIDEENIFYYQDRNDTIRIFLEEKYVKHKGFNLDYVILSPSEGDQEIYDVYGKEWNIDNFGPLKLPESKYFVLGDNRGKSRDSRVMGLISGESILGTIIYTF